MDEDLDYTGNEKGTKREKKSGKRRQQRRDQDSTNGEYVQGKRTFKSLDRNTVANSLQFNNGFSQHLQATSYDEIINNLSKALDRIYDLET